EQRCYCFATRILNNCPAHWSMVIKSGLYSVRDTMRQAEEFIRVYKAHPPYYRQKVNEQGMMYKELVTTAEVMQEVEKYDSKGSIWPSSLNYRFFHLVKLAYPMILYQD